MREGQRILERARTALGLSCLAATLLLTSPGVTTVRADEAAKPSKPEAKPTVLVPDRERAPIVMPPGDQGPGVDSQRGPIVLNTRGYNYGPNHPIATPVPAAPAPSSERDE